MNDLDRDVADCFYIIIIAALAINANFAVGFIMQRMICLSGLEQFIFDFGHNPDYQVPVPCP